MASSTSPPHLLMGDLHFGSTTLDDLKPSLNWIIEQQKTHQPLHVFVLGDTINSSKKIDPEAYEAATQFFGRLAKQDGTIMSVDLHVLIGNHDMIHPSTMDHHAFSCLEVIGDPHIHIYSKIQLLPFLNVLMVPYFQDQEVFMDWVDTHLTLEQSQKLVVYGHFHLDDAIATGFSSFHAPTTKGRRVLTSSWLAARFKRVITSHFHTHQILSERVEYTSSLIETRAGEGGDHGCILYYPDTDTSVFVKNPRARRFWDMNYKDLLSTSNPQQDDLVRNYQDHQLVCVRYNYDTPKRHLQEALTHVKQNLGITKIKTYMRSPMTEIVSQMRYPISTSATGTSEASILTPVAPISFDLNEQIVQFVNDGQTQQFWKSSSNDEEKENLVTAQHVIDTMQSLAAAQQQQQQQQPTSGAVTTKLLDITFDSITMTNFCSIPGTTMFQLGRDKPGVYVLEGNNGSGKSLVIEAIVWCFFDTTIRDMIKTKVAHTMKQPVSVSIRLENGYVIQRERLDTHASKMAHNKFSVTNHKQEVVCTDKDVFTREFLGVQSAQQFLNSMMLTTQKSRGFLHAKASVRQEMLETMMGLDFLKSYQLEIDEFLNQVNAQIEAYEQYQSDMEVVVDAQKRVLELQVEYDGLIEKQQQQEQQQLLLQQEKQDMDQVETSLYNENLSALTLAKEMIHVKWQSQIQQCNQEVETCKVDIASLMRDKQHLQQKKNQCTQEMQEIESILNDENHTAIKNLLTNFVSSEVYQQDTTPTVHSFLTVTLPSFLEGEHRLNLERLTQQVAQYAEELEQQTTQLKLWQSTLLDLTTKQKKLRHDQQAAVTQADSLIQACKSEHDLKERAWIQKREEGKSRQQLIVLTKKCVDDARGVCDRLSSKQKHMTVVHPPQPVDPETMTKAHIYRFWKDMLGTPTNHEPHRGAFRRFLRQSIIYNINLHLNHTIQELNHGEANRSLRLTLTNDLLLCITDPDDDQTNDTTTTTTNNNSYLLTEKSTQKESLAERNTLSFVESFKLELAIFFIIFQSLSFSPKQSKPNILFLDESLMGLDDLTVIQMIQYLRFSLLERTKTLKHIVILHAGSLPVMATTYLQGVIKCQQYNHTDTPSRSVPKSRSKQLIKRTKTQDVVPTSIVKWEKYNVIHYQ